MDRRDFIIKTGVGLLGAGVLSAPGAVPYGMAAPAAPRSLNGRRILTFNSVIRVNQIEVTRTRNQGDDEADLHTPDSLRALRESFAAGWPARRARAGCDKESS
jgi:hypothetical protein